MHTSFSASFYEAGKSSSSRKHRSWKTKTENAELNSFPLPCSISPPSPTPLPFNNPTSSPTMVYTIVVHLQAKKGNEAKLAAKLAEASAVYQKDKEVSSTSLSLSFPPPFFLPSLPKLTFLFFVPQTISWFVMQDPKVRVSLCFPAS